MDCKMPLVINKDHGDEHDDDADKVECMRDERTGKLST